jgi:hypothetical protein
MGVSLLSHHYTTGQQDVRLPLPIPMVYEDTPPVLAQWEYHVLTIDTREEELPAEAQLNALGKEGWLLVGMLEQRGSREHGLVYYYFVRQQL